MGSGENFPNDDITPTINQEILFIVIQFSQWTKQMIELMKNLYKEKVSLNYLQRLTYRIQKLKKYGNILKIQQKKPQQLLLFKNSASKVKENHKERPKAKVRALEASLNEKNFKNFNQIVFEKSFEDNVLQINNINKTDFQIIEQGKWKCILTKEPYAQGMMKSVYLLKKKNDPRNDLYVIKMPLEGFYETLDEAKEDGELI